MTAPTLETDAIKGANGSSLRHPGGRPRKLDVARFLRICALVQRGVTNTQACLTEDVDYGGFRTHIRRKPWWAKRFQIADQIRDEYVRDYHLAQVTKHAKEGNWLCSAWILERKFPHLFALHYTQHRTDESAEQPVGNEISIERLAEYGRLMLEFAKENEGTQHTLEVVRE